MFIYLVKMIRYDLFDTMSDVQYVFRSKQKATQVVEELNKNNKDPIEADDYGPIRGTEYVICTIPLED